MVADPSPNRSLRLLGEGSKTALLVDEYGKYGTISPHDGEGDNDISAFCQLGRCTNIGISPDFCAYIQYRGFGVVQERHLSGHLSLFWLAIS
jgi:hypothetical protein